MDPASVGAAEDPTVRIQVAAGDRPPRLGASAGRIERVRAASNGLWLADLLLPPPGEPRVAIVSAFAGERCGFAPVALAGWVKAPVAARPGERVELEVGSSRFGPVWADAAGRAVVPVFVLPGTRSAWGGGRQVAIPSRAGGGLHLALSRGEPAAGTVEVDATVFAVAADGAPWTGAAPALTATAGDLTPLAPRGPGAWQATWRVSRADATAGLAARLGGEALAVRLVDVAGPVARLEVRTDRPRAQAGDPAPVEVEVRAFDADGLPADAEAIDLESDLALAEANMIERGRWRASLLVPAALDGLRAVQIRARAGAASGAASVELAGGPPATLQGWVTLQPPTAAGPAIGRLTAEAGDAYGNPASTEGLTAAAARGRLGPARAAGDGRVDFPYQLETAGSEQAEDLLTVRLGELSAEVPLRLLAPPPSLALSPRAGVALRSGGAGPHAGAELCTWSRLGGEVVGLAVGGGAWSFRSSGKVEPGGLGWRGEVRLAAVIASVAWRTRLAPRLLLVASAGGGAGYVQNRTELAAQRPLTEARWAALGTAALGLGARAWRGGPFLEARATWAPNPQLDSLRGAFAAFSFALGYWLDVR